MSISTQRAPGRAFSPSTRLALADRIRALLAEHPNMTLTELARRSGAPHAMVCFVRSRWRTTGAA